jgi:hypothetical protein
LLCLSKYTCMYLLSMAYHHATYNKKWMYIQRKWYNQNGTSNSLQICCYLCVLILNNLLCIEVVDQDEHKLSATTWHGFIIALNWILLDLSVQSKYHLYQQSMLCWWVPYILNIYKNSINRKSVRITKSWKNTCMLSTLYIYRVLW